MVVVFVRRELPFKMISISTNTSTTMTRKQLIKLEEKCYELNAELSGALGNLAKAASGVLGYEVVAACGGC